MSGAEGVWRGGAASLASLRGDDAVGLAELRGVTPLRWLLPDLVYLYLFSILVPFFFFRTIF